jgi:hypothetical protein
VKWRLLVVLLGGVLLPLPLLALISGHWFARFKSDEVWNHRLGSSRTEASRTGSSSTRRPRQREPMNRKNSIIP